ncbi:CRISPR-associated Cse1 family protein [Humitalea rosea]|uniref:CRISPR-associated Cse1 family protein n=1 Tax=Humitalea rosea TaxID=990373 RepID=A0A2W7IZD0_9PROT|nr:type I-E CRISPR-associated protein Cse1/CasA [Humitalea rosea]PZW44787.1 CRISPR-associated Cse1 family protein [Humitalea rosea]
MFNLITFPWLPIRRASGLRSTIRPAQITETTDPIVALDWPRADFRVASLEFLIGLLATACPPEGHGAWREGWEAPPDPDALDAAFAPLAHAFNLDGQGPRFLQDLEDLVSDAEPIERLLIEAPGASTQRQNTDLLVHRGRIATLGRPAAAMALFTFQSWAPAGGAGNRTGLRGGGPMTTLVRPGDRPSLWQQIWANVPRGEIPGPEDLPRILPWLASSVTSEGARVVTPETAHPLQAWWGMPRRIRLDFSEGSATEPCGLTGAADAVQVRSWRQRPRGANYAGWGRVHPLTPHYALKAAAEYLPLHPQPGGVGYRHWLGLVVATPDGLRLPAKAIASWRDTREIDAGGGRARLLAAGYDMDNMKARAFVESEMPLPAAPDKAAREAMDALAARLVVSANQIAGLLRSAIRFALFSAGATVKLEAELLSTPRERLWEQTEPLFFALLQTPPDAAPLNWLTQLRRIALALFDEAAPMTPENGGAAPRISRARRNLVFALLGYGKEGAALFQTLGLPAVEAKPKTAKGKSA